jgi:hypothetical protein
LANKFDWQQTYETGIKRGFGFSSIRRREFCPCSSSSRGLCGRLLFCFCNENVLQAGCGTNYKQIGIGFVALGLREIYIVNLPFLC